MDKLERINELVNTINQHNINYYTLDNPTISDKQYDELYNELIQFEKETGKVLPNSPTQKIGGQTLDKFEKIEHKKKLWSLDKAQSFDELKDWMKKCEVFVREYNKIHSDKLPIPTFIVEKKFDGITMKCDYNNTDFLQGSTRGTGSIGELVTEQCKGIINLPLQLEDNDKTMISASFHGECLMPRKALIEYNKVAKEPLKNCRNGVAGAIRNLDPKETAKRKPIIYFYNINDFESNVMKHETYQQQLEYMSYRGLPIAEYMMCYTYEEIISCIDVIEEGRKEYAYDIDGAVVSINDLKTRELMGYTIKFPKWAISYKYEAEELTTKLIGIEWNTSRQGKIVPTGLLEPVELGGTTVKRATLNNLDDIERKGVKLNSEIFIRRSNDVIPEVMGVIEESLTDDDVKDIVPPSKCPSCGADTEIRQDNKTRYVYCTNTMSCKAQLSKSIDHYSSRQAMNIIGLSEKTIEKFIELGILKSIADLYVLKKDKNKELILKQEGFQLPSYNKLIKAIEDSKKCKLTSFIFALGIPNVGIKTAQTLVEFAKGETSLDTINNILNLKVRDLLKMEDCGEVVANSVYKWFHDTSNIEVLGYLTQMELTFIEDKPKEAVNVEDNPLKDRHIYPTGKFNLTKSELKLQLEKVGAIVETGYKKSLDYLICGGDTSKSGKVTKAQTDGVKLMTEDEMIKIFEQFIN